MNPPSASVDLLPVSEPQPEYEPQRLTVLVNVRADEVRVGDRIRNLGPVQHVRVTPLDSIHLIGTTYTLWSVPDQRLAVWRTIDV